MFKKFITVFLAATLLFSLAACSQPTPEEEVMQTIDQMIKVIEDGKREVILQKYAKIPPGKNIDKDDFSENKAKQLLDFLKQAKASKPQMSDNQETARFKVHGTHRELVFSKIDGQWKLNN
jgi:ABC-type transporter MlaC component